MTSSDEPFRRPPPGVHSGQPGSPTSDIGLPDDTPTSELYKASQTLDDSMGQHPQDSGEGPVVRTEISSAEHPAPVGPPPRRPTMKVFATALGVASTAALVVGLLIDASPTPGLVPAVADLPTQPMIAWSAEGGEICGTLDDSHAILSQPNRVWSLDLRSGKTQWSVGLTAQFTHISCLPGADLVAVSEVTAYQRVLGIRLLDGSTGDEVARLSGGSTVQVIPLGTNVGLLGNDQTLSMVKPGKFDSPIWSRRLPGPTGRLDTISARQIDETAVQLTYSVFRDIDDSSAVVSAVLAVKDGETPAWVEAGTAEIHSYERVGDIIVRNDGGGYVETVMAVDQHGREIWKEDDARAMIAGSRIFLASQRDWDSWSQLREVDVRSGRPINDTVFDENFGSFMHTADGRPIVLQKDLLQVFDEHFQPREPISSEGFRFLFQGTDQFYLGLNVSVNDELEKVRMTAFSAADATVSWTLELPSGQTVEQVGSHLVVVDHESDEILGLRSS